MISLILQLFLQKLCFYTSTLLPCLFIVLFMYKILSARSINGKLRPPSPPRLPIIGNLHQIGELPHQSFASFSMKYGKVMLLHFGSKPILVVSTPEAACEIMKTQDQIFCNRPQLRIPTRLFYGCRDVGFAPYGEHWRRMKSLCITHMLCNKKVRSYRKMREEEVALIVDQIKQSSQSSSVVKLSEVISKQTYDLICRAIFRRKYSSNDNNGGSNFKKLLDATVVLLGVFTVGDYIPWLSWVDRVTGLDRRVERVAQEFDESLDKLIQEHQNRLSSKKMINAEFDEQQRKDVAKNCIEGLLEIHMEDENAVTMDDVKANILDLVAAGNDTTRTLLEWTMSELLRHPKVMKILQEELRTIVGDKSNNLKVNEDDLENLPYLKAVIKESLRLHPPVPLLVFRQPMQDAKINGFDIGADTHVYINAWAIHRDPTYWDEPMEFRPERFLNTSTFSFKRQDDFRYIPFGGGRRICPGIDFAMVNAEVMLANLVYEFDWKVPAECGELDMTETVGIAVHKRDPLMVIATPYSSS
ncbi:cytochrome P450 71A3-like [Chenopodium quinoa]|uniref:cytochrome P450 71A3-like n=1 Tax=Chenopodium quinoa TaxID=63459 RepID=UPI000B78F8A1|nr:cytochrome P450 71A3-like [Chenopodium quinoa]